jgi:hypothetical protein
MQLSKELDVSHEPVLALALTRGLEARSPRFMAMMQDRKAMGAFHESDRGRPRPQHKT